MAVFSHEYWIWTELLAFDNTSPDKGVKEYLKNVDAHPDGICLLLNHRDIILLHAGMEKEYVLFPDVCSRRAHDRNTIRHRQEWTNWQLRDLVSELKASGVKVFLSIFSQNHDNQYHQEWIHSNRYKHAFFCDIAHDGRDFADIFSEKLKETMVDYGFSGYHGADGTGPAGWFMIGAFPIPRQKIFEKFIQDNNITDVPEKFRFIDEFDVESRRERSVWIWVNFPRQWQTFMTGRWRSFFTKVADALHSVGCEFMQNSSEAKGLFEGAFFFGGDTREIGRAGADYLLVCSVATSCVLGRGIDCFPERPQQIYASVQELSAALPDTKIVTMTGICDPVESFNSIRHAPAMLEKDIYYCANQTITTPEGDRRCSDGMLVCLGDSLEPVEWQQVKKFLSKSVNFTPAVTEGFTWLYSDKVYDNMMDSYFEFGTIPPYMVSYTLAYRGVMLANICRSENMHLLADRPLFVPNFDLLPDDEWQQVKSRKALTVLFGNIKDADLPPGSRTAVVSGGTPGYTPGLVIMNGKSDAPAAEIPALPQDFQDFLPKFLTVEEPIPFKTVADPIPTMRLSDDFWDACAAAMKEEVNHPFHSPGHAIIHRTAEGKKRIALSSKQYHYFVPDFEFDESKTHDLSLVSDYVCTDPVVSNGKLAGKGSVRIYNRIVVPPMGILAFEDDEK